MSKCRARRCKCGADFECPIDVCVNPIIGDPTYLTVLAPVVYDGIGINLCRSVPLELDIPRDFPSAARATAQVLNIAVPAGAIEPIPAKPNCFLVSLSDITVTVAVRIYDCCNRLLRSLVVNPVYLPTDATSPDYEYHDEDTNPELVELEIFAPYGVSYTNGDVNTPELSFIGYTADNNMLKQGIVMSSIPKVLDFDTADSSITLGLTVFLQSVYYTPYEVKHKGKASYTKAELASKDESVCMDFVAGSLLEHSIKPLELGPPMHDEELKKDIVNNI